jgi:DNA-binding GntR family transcriptional regulator
VPEPLNRKSKVPLSRQIAAILRAQIQSGEISPGEAIPSRKTIMQSYEVAAGTADKAVRILRDEGLVETSFGLGIFVTDPDDDG